MPIVLGKPLNIEFFSTTTPLGIGGVFTSSSIEILSYGKISGLCFADQASAANGLEIQQSLDDTNWDFSTQFSVVASTGFSFSVPVTGRFVRIRYTNGAVAQTTFRLSGLLKPV